MSECAACFCLGGASYVLYYVLGSANATCMLYGGANGKFMSAEAAGIFVSIVAPLTLFEPQRTPLLRSINHNTQRISRCKDGAFLTHIFLSLRLRPSEVRAMSEAKK
jgi:hypothetical protein